MDKRVLIVDDSLFMRNLLSYVISQIKGFTVVYAATDPYDAAQKIIDLEPDIITLDINMPKMDGLTFLEKIMRLHPKPVIIISSMAEEKSEITLEALELGAVDYILKPQDDFKKQEKVFVEKVRQKLLAASISKPLISSSKKLEIKNKKLQIPDTVASDKIIAIGASTGGTNAISDILSKLTSNFPAVLVAQHMPAGFTKLFAERLNRECQLFVHEAVDLEPVLQGHVYIAPGGKQMLIKKQKEGYHIKIEQAQTIHRYKPSVDILFNSVALAASNKATGIILTGMGDDGSEGLLAMKQAGAFSIAQNEASSVVYGMPKVAYQKGAVDKVFSLSEIADFLIKSY